MKTKVIIEILNKVNFRHLQSFNSITVKKIKWNMFYFLIIWTRSTNISTHMTLNDISDKCETSVCYLLFRLMYKNTIKGVWFEFIMKELNFDRKFYFLTSVVINVELKWKTVTWKNCNHIIITKACNVCLSLDFWIHFLNTNGIFLIKCTVLKN